MTHSLQEVVPSFAVAKVYQIPNTNQILTRKSLKLPPQSCTHFPLNKTLTTMEKILCRRCNIPPLSLGITLKSTPKSSVSLRFHPRPPLRRPKTQPQRSPKSEAKGRDLPSSKGAPRARQKEATTPPKRCPKGEAKGGDHPAPPQG